MNWNLPSAFLSSQMVMTDFRGGNVTFRFAEVSGLDLGKRSGVGM
jgi:hypothetical protein